MKKSICALFAFFILLGAVLPIPANAVSPRIVTIVPGLSFTGTTAHCEVTVLCDYATDEIDATMRLWEGNTCIATWSDSDEGSLSIYETETVTPGNEYTVTADVTINGEANPRVYIRRTCPKSSTP